MFLHLWPDGSQTPSAMLLRVLSRFARTYAPNQNGYWQQRDPSSDRARQAWVRGIGGQSCPSVDFNSATCKCKVIRPRKLEPVAVRSWDLMNGHWVGFYQEGDAHQLLKMCLRFVDLEGESLVEGQGIDKLSLTLTSNTDHNPTVRQGTLQLSYTVRGFANNKTGRVAWLKTYKKFPYGVEYRGQLREVRDETGYAWAKLKGTWLIVGIREKFTNSFTLERRLGRTREVKAKRDVTITVRIKGKGSKREKVKISGSTSSDTSASSTSSNSSDGGPWSSSLSAGTISQRIAALMEVDATEEMAKPPPRPPRVQPRPRSMSPSDSSDSF